MTTRGAMFPLLTIIAACAGSVEPRTDTITVAPIRASFATNAAITVEYAGMPGRAGDWLGLFVAGSADDAPLTRVSTGGARSGVATFSAPSSPGSYVVRIFFDGERSARAESPAFSVMPPPTLSTDATEYFVGDDVIVSFANFAGNETDWVSIYGVDDPDIRYLSRRFTRGATSGTFVFHSLPAGLYDVRGFFADTFQREVESAPFLIKTPASLVPLKQAYASGETVAIDFANMPGGAGDWIGIFSPGAPDTAIIAARPTEGARFGLVTIGGLADGTYVARGFGASASSGTVRAAESIRFTIGPIPSPVTLTTSAASYASGASVDVSYVGLPGTAVDWIAVYPANATSDADFVAQQSTHGLLVGDATFAGLPDGTYVARAVHDDGGLERLGESAPFSIAPPPPPPIPSPTFAPDALRYTAGGAPIAVSFAHFPATSRDWIGLFLIGSGDELPVAAQSTAGAASGTVRFGGVPIGCYTLRAFLGGALQHALESAPIEVAAATTLTPSKLSYASAESVTIAFDGMPGSSTDWIGIFAPDASDTAALAVSYTGGLTSGTLVFAGLVDGTYVARGYADDSFTREAETVVFVVGSAGP